MPRLIGKVFKVLPWRLARAAQPEKPCRTRPQGAESTGVDHRPFQSLNGLREEDAVFGTSVVERNCSVEQSALIQNLA